MGTPLKAVAVIGSKVSSVVVQGVTVLSNGAVIADWQGLDASGQAVMRQSAAFSPEDAKKLLDVPMSGLVSAAESAIVSAIASSGEAPPKDLPAEIRGGPIPQSTKDAPAHFGRFQALQALRAKAEADAKAKAETDAKAKTAGA